MLVHGLESHTAFLDIGGHRVDDGVGPGDSGSDRGLVAHVGVHGRDPIQASRAQDAPRALGMPDRDPYSRPSVARCRTSRRPRNPVPPNTLTVLMALPPACWPRLNLAATNDNA